MATLIHPQLPGDFCIFSSAVERITVQTAAPAVDISLHTLDGTGLENLVFSETYYPYSRHRRAPGLRFRDRRPKWCCVSSASRGSESQHNPPTAPPDTRTFLRSALLRPPHRPSAIHDYITATPHLAPHHNRLARHTRAPFLRPASSRISRPGTHRLPHHHAPHRHPRLCASFSRPTATPALR